jgi:hypothetical protein
MFDNDPNIPTHKTPPQSTQPDTLDELKLKGEVFNALSVFELELSARTPHGTKFWLDIKKAVDKYSQAHFLEIIEGCRPDLKEDDMTVSDVVNAHDEGYNLAVSDYHTNLVNKVNKESK